MARNWRQRFDVTQAAAGTGASESDALRGIQEANDRAFADFQKGLISADQAMAEFADALRKLGRDANMTVEERERLAASAESQLNDIAAQRGVAGVSPEDLQESLEAVVDLGKYLSDEQKLRDELRENLEKFRDGLITADEAAERATRAIDRLGEKAGMTVEERNRAQKDAVADIGEEAEEMGEDGPIDPKNPMKGRLGRATKKLGLGKGVGEGIGDLFGSFQPKGGIVGAVAGKGGLLDAIGGGAGGGPLVLAGAVSKVVAEMYKGVADFTKKVGDVGVSIAKNDGIGAITGVMDGFADAAGKVPIVGEALQAQINAYTQFLKTFDQLTAAFAQRGEELKRYSGPIAVASAQSEVTRLLADIREGQNLGNEYAELISERTEMQVEFQKALEPIKRVIIQDLVIGLKVINKHLEVFNNGVEGLKRINEKSGGALKVIGDVAISFAGLPGLVYNMLEIFKMAPWGKPKENSDKLEDLMNVGRKGLDADEDVFREEAANSGPLGIDLFDDVVEE